MTNLLVFCAGRCFQHTTLLKTTWRGTLRRFLDRAVWIVSIVPVIALLGTTLPVWNHGYGLGASSTFASQPSIADTPTASRVPMTSPQTTVSSTTSTSQNEVNIEAQQRIQEAIRSFITRKTAEATLHLEAHLYDLHLSGTGMYKSIWDPRGLRFRFDLQLPLTGATAYWTQVCDGNWLWTLVDIHGVQLQRVDLGLIRSQLRGENKEIDWQWSGLGGFPRLLHLLNQCVQWNACTAVTLQEQPETSAPEAEKSSAYRLSTWKLTGILRENAALKYFLTNFTKNPTESPEETAEQQKVLREAVMATPYLPDQVTLYLDQKTLFPCRLEFYHTYPNGEKKLIVRMLAVEFQMGGEVSEDSFYYTSTHDYLDTTQEFLTRLRNSDF